MGLRIGLVAHGQHPLAEPYAGGLEAFTVRLVRGLRARGHHVLLYAAEGTPGDLADETVTFRRSPLGLGLTRPARVPASTPDPVDHPETRAYLAVAADLAGRDVDVVANHSLQPTLLACSAAFDAPTVTTFHTPLLAPVLTASALADHRARFTAVSAATAAAWAPLGRPVQVIDNGVDLGVFRPGPGGPRVVWSGRLRPDKGADLAVAAARRAGLGIDLVGPVSDADWYERTVVPLLDDDVRHLGCLTHRDLAQVLGRAHAALVTPRWEEPFGLVAAEALACGTPVVALRRGALPDVVGDAGVVVDSDDADSLADGIARAARLDRGAVAASAARRFDVERMVDAYVRLYEDAASGARPPVGPVAPVVPALVAPDGPAPLAPATPVPATGQDRDAAATSAPAAVRCHPAAS